MTGNPHDRPTALRDLQDSIYREKVLRARWMTVEERLDTVFELSNFTMRQMHAGAIWQLETEDPEEGWREVRRVLGRICYVLARISLVLACVFHLLGRVRSLFGRFSTVLRHISFFLGQIWRVLRRISLVLGLISCLLGPISLRQARICCPLS